MSTVICDDIRAVELVRLAGTTYRKVDCWTRRGLLVPVVHARGSGTQRIYPPSEIPIARLLNVVAPFAGARGDHGLSDAELRGMVARARSGFRGYIEPQPGVIFNLGVLCGAG